MGWRAVTDDEQDILDFNKLDDQISEFVDLEEGETVSGWVLVYQTTKFVNEPGYLPRQTATSCATSLGTTTETAVGLLRLAARRVEVEVTSQSFIFLEDDEE